MYCPKCGTQTPDDAAFCGKCGLNLIPVSPAPTPTIQPQYSFARPREAINAAKQVPTPTIQPQYSFAKRLIITLTKSPSDKTIPPEARLTKAVIPLVFVGGVFIFIGIIVLVLFVAAQIEKSSVPSKSESMSMTEMQKIFDNNKRMLALVPSPETQKIFEDKIKHVPVLVPSPETQKMLEDKIKQLKIGDDFVDIAKQLLPVQVDAGIPYVEGGCVFVNGGAMIYGNYILIFKGIAENGIVVRKSAILNDIRRRE